MTVVYYRKFYCISQTCPNRASLLTLLKDLRNKWNKRQQNEKRQTKQVKKAQGKLKKRAQKLQVKKREVTTLKELSQKKIEALLDKKSQLLLQRAKLMQKLANRPCKPNKPPPRVPSPKPPQVVNLEEIISQTVNENQGYTDTETSVQVVLDTVAKETIKPKPPTPQTPPPIQPPASEDKVKKVIKKIRDLTEIIKSLRIKIHSLKILIQTHIKKEQLLLENDLKHKQQLTNCKALLKGDKNATKELKAYERKQIEIIKTRKTKITQLQTQVHTLTLKLKVHVDHRARLVDWLNKQKDSDLIRKFRKEIGLTKNGKIVNVTIGKKNVKVHAKITSKKNSTNKKAKIAKKNTKVNAKIASKKNSPKKKSKIAKKATKIAKKAKKTLKKAEKIAKKAKKITKKGKKSS